MKWIAVPNYDAMAELGADYLYQTVAGKVQAGQPVNLGLATGNTMIGVYEKLAARLNADGMDLANFKSFNLDEYVGPDGKSVPVSHPLSYRRYMTENLFSRFAPERRFDARRQAFFPDGADPEKHDDAIRAAGGLDLQLLGIGFNGHIAFNEPMKESEISAAEFAKLPSRVIKLTELTLQTNTRLTAGGDRNIMPAYAATQGMATILEARKVLLLACFAEQTEPLRKIRAGAYTPELPASLLRDHADYTIVYTEDLIQL